jgi:hypothetical protein
MNSIAPSQIAGLRSSISERVIVRGVGSRTPWSPAWPHRCHQVGSPDGRSSSPIAVGDPIWTISKKSPVDTIGIAAIHQLRRRASTIATASALNSAVNDRRALGVFCFSIVDIITSFGK